jgi:CubicO group peptidase (beta-lactamase class C family)
MAASRARRAGVRRAVLILSSAAVIAVATLAVGPALSTPRQPALIGAAAPSPSLATGSPLASGPSTAPGATTPSASPSATPATSPLPGTPGFPIVAPPPAPVPRLAPATRLALQARLDQLRKRYGIPGISAAVLLPDGSLWSGVSGLADVAAERPVTRSTTFAIASVSKTFTSALVLALAEDGRIDLDAPVRRYLPTLKQVSPKILVRQLLDHTSGLRDYFFHPSIDHLLLADPDRRWTAADALRYVGKPYFAPGKGWHYSNTNYLVLGLLAEAVGRKPLADQIRTRFLRPLDLADTWFQPTDRAPRDIAHGYRFRATGVDAKPIDLTGTGPIEPFTSVVTAAGGAGGYASTPADLVHWARALYGGRVLRAETLARLTDVRSTARYDPRVPYGLGVQILAIDGVITEGHSGRILGFRSALRYVPERGIAVAVLTNQSRTDPGPILRVLLRTVLTADVPACRCFARR